MNLAAFYSGMALKSAIIAITVTLGERLNPFTEWSITLLWIIVAVLLWKRDQRRKTDVLICTQCYQPLPEK